MSISLANIFNPPNAPLVGTSFGTSTSPENIFPSFNALDHEAPGYFDTLDNLDHLPTRTGDTLLVFYVGAGQNKVEEILANVVRLTHLCNDVTVISVQAFAITGLEL